MGQLPVEHGPEPVGPDDEVAVAEVAVHDRVAAPAGGRLRVEPPEAELERGCGSPSGVERGRAAGRPGRPPCRSGTAPAGMAWMPASASPHWAGEAGRAAANSSSRRILRAIVSPSTRSTTIQAGAEGAVRPPRWPPRPAPARPRRRAARSRAASVRMPAVRALPCRSRWRMRGRPPASKAQVSRDAPPDRRRSPVTSPGPHADHPGQRRGEGGGALVDAAHSIGTRGRPSSSSWWRYSLMPYPVRPS